MAAKKPGIQRQFVAKFGEVGYTASQVCNMLDHLGLSHYSGKKVLDYAKENNLVVNLADEGIQGTRRSMTKYLIRDSSLDSIIEGLGIPVSPDQLRDVASELRMQY